MRLPRGLRSRILLGLIRFPDPTRLVYKGERRMGERKIARWWKRSDWRAPRSWLSSRGYGFFAIALKAAPGVRTRREITMGATPPRLWQADAPPEASKPRIGVKIVQTRVRGQINGQIIAPIPVRPLQPGKRLIFFAEARVNDGDVVGRDIGARRQFFQMVQHLPRFRLVP